jgi:nicotinate-nucleotide adenylyltransferase
MGGTFDPVHKGHLEAARELQIRAGLQQVWLMPNARPPHRVDPLASAGDRMRMVELAVNGEAGLAASSLEVDRGGVSYTIDTVRQLRRRFPDQRFEFLLGADAARHIREWHQAKTVLEEASFVIFNRPGTRLEPSAIEAFGFAPERTRTVHLDTPDVAAHEIRDRLRQGKAIEDLVPAKVAAYIREHHLYTGGRSPRTR